MDGKTIAKAIVGILVIVFIAGVIGIIYKFTNGFNEDFKTFYIEYNGKQILTSETKQDFEYEQTYTFGVKYTFDNDKTEPKDYSVKIVPNVTTDFDYTVNDDKYIYSKLKDLTGAFGIKKEKTYFELTVCHEDLIEVIRALYADKTVEIDEAVLTYERPFKLVISSYNGEVSYDILFNILAGGVTGITLDTTEIVFS